MECVSNRAKFNLLKIKCKSKAGIRLSYMNAGTLLERKNINNYSFYIYLRLHIKLKLKENQNSVIILIIHHESFKFILELMPQPDNDFFPTVLGGRNIFIDTHSTQKIQNLVLSVRSVPEG